MSKQRISQIRIGVVAAVLLASGVIFLLMPIEALRWAQTPFPGFLIDPNLVINAVGDDAWPAKQLQPPVTYPERIMAVNGEPVAGLAQFRQILADSRVGDELAFTLVQPQYSLVAPTRSQPSRTVVVPLIAISVESIWNQFWLLYLTGLVALVIGAWTFRARPGAEPAQVFALLMALGSLAIGALFDLGTTQRFVRIWLLALSMFGGLNVWLAAVFPHESRLIANRPWAKWAALLPGAAIGVWGQHWLYRTADPWSYAIPWRAAYLFNGVALLASFSILAYRSFNSPSPLVRQIGRIVLASAGIAFAPLLLFFAVSSAAIHLPWLTPTLYIPPLVIYPLAIGYTIIRFRLLNTDIVLRRGLTFILLTGLIVIALTLLVAGFTAATGQPLNLDNPVLLALFIAVIATLFDPLRSGLQKLVDQYFFRKPIAFDELLRGYNRGLTRATRVDQVADMLLKYARTAVLDAEPHLFLPDATMNCFSSIGGGHDGDLRLDNASPMVAFLAGMSGAIDLAVEGAWPPALRDNREAVRALDAAVIVPLSSGKELLGWLTLSHKPDNEHYTPAELAYLSALADQTIIGLERANVIHSLEARVAELNLLSQFSQYLNFTIDFDDLLELAFTNFQRLLGVEDFYVTWRDPDTRQAHTAFCVEGNERHHEREGEAHRVHDPRICQVMDTGQMLTWQDEDGRAWIAAPLNAGADTLGAIHTFFRQPDLSLRQRQEQLFSVFADRTAAALDRIQTRQKLEARAQQLETINQITFSLTSTLELEPLLDLVLDKAMELLDTEAGTLMLTREDTGDLEFRVVRGPASEALLGTVLPAGTGLAGTAVQTGRPVLVNNVREDTRWFSQVDANTDFETHSSLTVPLLRQNSVLGVLQVINKRNGAPFTEDDQTLLMAFAGQAVVALENSRLLQQTDRALQARVSELYMLQQLDRDLNTTLTLDRVLSLALDWGLRICGGNAGAIVLLDHDGRPELRAARGYDEEFDPAVVNSSDVGLVGRVIRSGKPHVTGNVSEEEGYVAAAFSTRSQMTLPIMHQKRLIGVLVIESDKSDAFDQDTLDTALRVASHAAIAIANAILYEQVNEANRTKSEFVSMVSHELKTPMTSMRGYTDLMLSGMTGELNEQQRKFLKTIAANIRRMGRQIQDLTDISRIETGRLRMEKAPTAFTNIISETLQTVQGPCDAKNIHLHLDLPADLPLVMGDKERLVQVLTNLVSNACKYSPPDTDVTIRLKADTLAAEDGQAPVPVVVCSVVDRGYGISEEDQQRLFTKFFRSDDANIRKATGTGLGLSITKGIVELHGGRIWVESELGKGTIFHFAIPQAV
ncbi:MAG: GAF domain-containing protein [Anaerolineae bacterium]